MRTRILAQGAVSLDFMDGEGSGVLVYGKRPLVLAKLSRVILATQIDGCLGEVAAAPETTVIPAYE